MSDRLNDHTSNLTDLFQVKLDPLSSCGSCSSSGGCGIQLLPATAEPLLLNCQVSCESPVSRGDRVSVRINEPDSGWLRIVCIAYGLPTTGMILGAAIGYWTASTLGLPDLQEPLSTLGFFLGLTGGLIAWSRAEKSVCGEPISQSRVETATIVRVEANSGEVI